MKAEQDGMTGDDVAMNDDDNLPIGQQPPANKPNMRPQNLLTAG